MTRHKSRGFGYSIEGGANRAFTIKQWRDQLLEAATGVFGGPAKAELEPLIDVKTLHAKIGELTLENDFLSGALGKAGLLPSARK